MKATFERAELLAALKVVGAARPRRGGSLPVLSGVKMHVDGAQATLTCTDLERTVTTTVPCGLDSTAGVIVVPHGRLTDVLGGFRADEVMLEADDDLQVKLNCGRASGGLNLLPVTEWPRNEVAVDGDPVKLHAFDLDTIERCLFAASKDAQRPILTGVLFDGAEVVCLDSYRLAVGTLKVEVPKMLMPSDFLAAVLRGAGEEDLSLVADLKAVAFTAGDTTWTSRLIYGEYPIYRTLIPKASPMRLSIDRDDLLEALASVSTIGSPVEKDKGWEPVHVTFDGDRATFRITQQGVGVTEAVVDAGGTWPERGVGFNPNYLADMVNAMCEHEVIDLDAVDSHKPIVAVDPTVTCLMMPVRIKGVTD